MASQSEFAEVFRSLHHGGRILVLPNAWDCASARIFEAAGFPAIATTSAGVAFSLGYPDGQKIPADEMLAAVRRIVRSVNVPVTADLEGGYDSIEETTDALIESGAIGLNLEDIDRSGLVGIDKQIENIQAVRERARRRGVDIVINARTDLYLARIGDPSTLFQRSLERLKLYSQAGADCLFLPGVTDENLIQRFVEALKFPLNVLATPGIPSIARLQELGVARVTAGSGIMRATMGLTQRIAADLRDVRTFDRVFDGAMSYPDCNALFEV